MTREELARDVFLRALDEDVNAPDDKVAEVLARVAVRAADALLAELRKGDKPDGYGGVKFVQQYAGRVVALPAEYVIETDVVEGGRYVRTRSLDWMNGLCAKRVRLTVEVLDES